MRSEGGHRDVTFISAMHGLAKDFVAEYQSQAIKLSMRKALKGM